MSTVSALRRRLEKLEEAAKAKEDRGISYRFFFTEYGQEPELLGRDLRRGERLVTDETVDGNLIIRVAQRATTDPDDYGLIFDKDGRQIGRFLGPPGQPGRICEIEEEREICSPSAS